LQDSVYRIHSFKVLSTVLYMKISTSALSSSKEHQSEYRLATTEVELAIMSKFRV
jgi:hypothetical protein